MDNGQGWFVVKLPVRGGAPVAVLTGEHFSSDERMLAMATIGINGKSDIVDGGSPAFLAKDSAVRFALQARRRALRDGFSACHAGDKGMPCGECELCDAARNDAFTRILLGAVEVYGRGLSERLRNVLSSVVGSVWVDAPWETAMDDEEVDDVFKELGVEPKKG